MLPHPNPPTRGTIISMRVVSLLPSATEMLWALGVGDSVVAVSHECDYPPEALTRQRVVQTKIDPRNLSREIDSQVEQLLARGEPLFLIDIERLRELQPDVIVTQAVCEVCAVSPKEILPLQKVLPTVKTVLLKATSLEGVIEDILHVAEAVGVPERGTQLVEQMRNSLDEVSQAVAGKEQPSVACVEWLAPPYIAGHWVPEMVALAGGKDLLGQAGAPSWRTTWDHIATSDPDIVVLMPCGFSLKSVGERVKELADQPAFLNLRALKEGQVYGVDANAHFSRPGPRLVEGLRTLAGIFHPDSGFRPVARKVLPQDVSLPRASPILKTSSRSPLPTLRIFYDDSCPLCVRSAHSARQWLEVPAEFIGLKSQEALSKGYRDQITVEVVSPTQEETFQAEQAWLTLFAYGPPSLRLLSRILRVPPFRWLLPLIYRFIAKRRHLWHRGVHSS